ncbi:MAG: hypothetical protein JXA13_12260 [Anaerolineales bacterium]|nr:hypothetical protein [Anaerolineales bacterium]
MGSKNGSTRPNDKKSYSLGLIVFLALLFYALFIYRTAFFIHGETYFTLIDDAMISMRYARNLSNGFGLVWNAGQPPVEGFTNLGWTLYMACLHQLPVPASQLSLLVMITSALLLLGNTVLAFRLSKCIAPALKLAPLIAAAVISFYYPLVFWSLRGTEVALVTFLVYWSVLLVLDSGPGHVRQTLMPGLLMLFAIVVRFDALLQVVLLLGYSLIDGQIKRRAGFGSSWPMLLCCLAGAAGVLLFQYLYFGSLFPNTYALKVEGVSWDERLLLGIQVFVEYAARDFLGPLILIIAGILYYPDLQNRRTFLLLAMFLIQCMYSIFIGGDYAEPLSAPQVDAANRFITQGMPAIIIMSGVVVERFMRSLGLRIDNIRQPRRLSWGLVFGISLAALALISGEPWFKWSLHNAPLLNIDIQRARLGVHIRQNTQKNAVIAAHAAGQIPYYSDRQTVDLLGKSDPIIAHSPPAAPFRPGHNKWNYEYSIRDLKPDLVADEWGQLGEFLASEPEYERLENGIWIRRQTTNLDIDGLAAPFQE